MTQRHQKIFAPFLVFVISFIAALPSLNYDFFGDDTILILENPDVQSVKNIPGLYRKDFFDRPIVGIPSKSLIGYFRPFTKTTFALDWMIWKRNALGYHLTNILVHSAVSVSLLFLLIGIGLTLPISFACAVIFAVFPTHDQAISIVNARSDLLCVLGILLACIGSIKDNYFLTTLGCFLAPFSKEQGLFAVPMMWAVNYIHRRKVKKYKFHMYIGGGILILYLALRHFATHPQGISHSIPMIFNTTNFILIGKLFQVLSMSIAGLGTSYLGLLLVPVSISVGVLLGWMVFFACVWMAVKNFKKQRKYFFSLGWILLGFLPMLAAHMLAIPLGKWMIPTMDRWAYLPSVGTVLILGLVMNKRIVWRKKTYGIFSIIIATLMFSLWMRMATYKNDRNFNIQTLKIYQQKPYDQLPVELRVRRLDTEGILLAQEGKLDEALEHLNQGYDLSPDDVLISANLGVVYAQMENYEKAIFYLEKSLHPKMIYQDGDQIRYLITDDDARNRPQRYASLAEVYRRSGNPAASEAAMKQAVQGDPTNLVYLNNLAGVIANQKRIDEAKEIYLDILEIDPCYETARESILYIFEKTHDETLKNKISETDRICPR